jgi:N-acetylglucosamine kinase-like BadF-type ATPase
VSGGAAARPTRPLRETPSGGAAARPTRPLRKAPSDALPAVLAIDGGNSKTDAALVAPDGTVLASARGPGTEGATDLPDTLRLLAGLIARLQAQAGRSGYPAAQHLSACVANADLPEEEAQLAAALRAQGWTVSSAVFNDTFAVLRAGLPPGPRSAGPQSTGSYWGVAVTCGAGINCVGLAPDGRTARFLALGTITGDWGGGHGLGKAALWWAMRAEDGRGPDTALREAVAAHFGAQTVSGVAIGIHLGKLDEDNLAGLAPAVLAAAHAGDEVAARLVRKQASEVCTMAVAAMRRLDLLGSATPVVLGGSLLSSRDPLLTGPIIAGLAERAPRATVHIADIPPVAGAALLGLDHLGASETVQRRLQTCYATPPP